ncbi:putative ABC transporter permease protein [Caprobacter fermentans]|uniref:Putative ABC transporter permease protein n=1 Tax=Caproicibacter fermentans TaxID=2576756 RepID=A0A6N8HY53_9FIRM|nr:iron ABC transporter permease [Caproicibacter fermentans]MVB10692.1 putative ABC transporter permease protein [Caproicibacter fermentans]
MNAPSVRLVKIGPRAGRVSVSQKRVKIAAVLPILPIAAFLFSLTVGRYGIPLPEFFRLLRMRALGIALEGNFSTMATVLFGVRLPWILSALLVGAALSASGATNQGIFKNPMVSPDILGASAGAGFGAALAILNSFGIPGIELSSFLGGITAVLMTSLFTRAVGRHGETVLLLILTGMVVQNLFSAFTSITKYVADPNDKLPEITFWLMGGLSSITWREVWMLLIPCAAGMIPLFLSRWQINALTFGDEEAQSLGVDTRKIRILLIFSSTLLTSASIAVSGMIGWVGLIIPHLTRLVVGPNYKTLLPASVLIGSAFLLLVDNAARCIFPTEIPLGILTSIIGAPFFLYLLLKRRGAAE